MIGGVDNPAGSPGGNAGGNNHKLRQSVEKHAARMRKAEHERPTLLAQTVFLGTLGLLLVLPIVFGAYLGSWLDGRLAGYSVNWTTSLIIIGVFVGAGNVYLLIKRRQ